MYLTTEIKISFIIPLFNGEKYIQKCIDSIINQDYGANSYEIICVDDCSKDNSQNIIKDYQKDNLNIELIENKANLKTGTACNIGLENAKGDYIWVIGQDDWIHKDSIGKLYPLITTVVPDVIAFNYRRVDFDENELHSAEVFDNSGSQKGGEYIRKKFGEAYPHYLLGYEWRALYNRKYLKKYNIRFPDGGIYEDTTFLFKAILNSQRFISISEYLYFYRVNPYSITDFNRKYKGNLVFEFAFKVGNEVLDLAYEIEDSYPDFSKQLFEMARWYFNGFTFKLIAASFKEKMNFYKETTANNILISSAWIHLRPMSKILIKKPIGLLLSVLLIPAYLFKKKVIDRNKIKRKWSY